MGAIYGENPPRVHSVSGKTHNKKSSRLLIKVEIFAWSNVHRSPPPNNFWLLPP